MTIISRAWAELVLYTSFTKGLQVRGGWRETESQALTRVLTHPICDVCRCVWCHLWYERKASSREQLISSSQAVWDTSYYDYHSWMAQFWHSQTPTCTYTAEGRHCRDTSGKSAKIKARQWQMSQMRISAANRTRCVLIKPASRVHVTCQQQRGRVRESYWGRKTQQDRGKQRQGTVESLELLVKPWSEYEINKAGSFPFSNHWCRCIWAIWAAVIDLKFEMSGQRLFEGLWFVCIEISICE